MLAREPRNAAAAHLLGLALKDGGDWVEGERWLRFSIELEPQRGEFHANLANLLRKRRQHEAARQSYERALALLPQHRAARHGLALVLNELKRYDEAERECRALLSRDPADIEAWVILGIALESLGRLAEAEEAYRKAIGLDPNNRVAHHNLGALLASLERTEAVQALDTARRLGADGYTTAYNRGRASLNEGNLDEAEQELARAAEMRPGSLDAQLALAQVRFMRGDPHFARTLGDALRANRGNVRLQLLLGELLWRAGELTAAETVVRDVIARKSGPSPAAQSTLSAILLEQGRLEEAEAQALEAAAARPQDQAVLLNTVTILIAGRRVEDAIPLIEAQRRQNPDSQAWLAYEATASRLLGTERYRELYDYERFVRVYDLEPPPGWSSMAELNRALAEVLNDRHRFTNHPLDQTLRHGSQTSRSLLMDPDPTVQSVLEAFQDPIEDYRRSLDLPPEHPLSRANVGASKFVGAWSVRLKRNGYHVNHFHPEGLISSAYYIEIPSEAQDEALKAGWIKFGEPRYPVPELVPERLVQPRPGRLVLFPSYMWHGTNPIYGSEARLSIAFDVRPTVAAVK